MKFIFKKGTAIVLAISLAITGIVVTKKSEKSVKAATVYELVWSDEFNGNSLDTSIWNVEVNGYGGWNNERQYYTNNPKNIEVSNGTLKITAYKESYQGKEYTSARINTEGKKTFQFGKVEARMKLPCFMGAFPAFWMMGEVGSHPANGEIDIMEAINNESILYGSVHWEKEGALSSKSGATYGMNVDITKFHTYGVEWTKDQLSWYVDDKVYSTVPIKDEEEMQELRQPFYLLLNFAIGGSWPEEVVNNFKVDDAALPQTMEVDYIKVYQQKEVQGEDPTTTNPAVTVEDVLANYTGKWTGTVGDWANAKGTFTAGNKAADGFTYNFSAIGNDMWGSMAQLTNLPYTAGKTYTYKTTFLSNIDKTIFVKVEGDNQSALDERYVKLEANVPYEYQATVSIPAGYTGSLMLLVAPGGPQDGETLGENTAMTLKASNVSFSTNVPKTETNVLINGYQVSSTLGGIRTVYSVNDTTDVSQIGLIYGLADKSSASDLVIGSNNSFVHKYDATSQGISDVNYSGNAKGNSYLMTMKFGDVDKSFFSQKINVRAYVKLKDGTIKYSDVKTFSIFDVAKTLYNNKSMYNETGHNYLYNNILNVVQPGFTKVNFGGGNYAIVS